jgi:hypothetical protein
LIFRDCDVVVKVCSLGRDFVVGLVCVAAISTRAENGIAPSYGRIVAFLMRDVSGDWEDC